MTKFFNWTEAKTYGEGHLSDYTRDKFYVHDNGWGTIQISVLHGCKEKDNPYREAETAFAFVDYKTEANKNGMAQWDKNQAFTAAIAMCDGLIAAKIDVESVKDNSI
jgi:hypothetical protein